MQEFNEVIKSDKPTVVDFYAEWCPSCMQMLPAYVAVAQDLQDKVNFIKVDADNGAEIMKAYQVEKVPTLLCLQGR